MRLIILTLLLLSFSALAEFKVEYIETSTGGTYSFEKNTEAKAKTRLIKIIKKSQWMQGEWNQVESPISKEEKYTDAVDTGETQTIQDIEGNDIEVPIYTYEEKTRLTYFHPSNFTYTITDITQELADKAADKQADKNERIAIKAMKSEINASDLPVWHKRILKKLIKDMRD